MNRRLRANNTLYIYDDQNELGSVKDGLIQERRILGIGQGAEIGAAIAIELNNQLYCSPLRQEVYYFLLNRSKF